MVALLFFDFAHDLVAEPHTLRRIMRYPGFLLAVRALPKRGVAPSFPQNRETFPRENLPANVQL